MDTVKTQAFKSPRIGEEYIKVIHSSGLPILLYPMKGFNSAYALFATKYGSVDTRFKTGGDTDFIQVPEGIAHFLEHKMFESEEGDAFAKYAKTGASANAYTSFDNTAYLFSCTDNFAASLEILLECVTTPYFTEQTVQKEQGIIGQEIKMYQDNPEWRVFFNALRALYHNHPIRVDIAGTVDSIAEIGADTLYRCYNTFYNLGNMALCVAGNFEPEAVLEIADRLLKPAKEVVIERKNLEEPFGVYQKKIEQILPVALPLFVVAFKADPAPESENPLNQILDELLLDIVAGESTPLYRRLYDEGLINSEFGAEAMSSRDYSLVMFTGESREPERVMDAILEEIARVRSEGISPEVFDRYKKTVYGGYIGAFGKVETVARMLLSAHFSGVEIYDILERIAAVTLDDLNLRLTKSLDPERCVISIVKSDQV